jgi:hypothetical protein
MVGDNSVSTAFAVDFSMQVSQIPPGLPAWGRQTRRCLPMDHAGLGQIKTVVEIGGHQPITAIVYPRQIQQRFVEAKVLGCRRERAVKDSQHLPPHFVASIPQKVKRTVVFAFTES